MFCSTCGKEIVDSAVICPSCGSPTKNFNQINNQQPQQIIINQSQGVNQTSGGSAIDPPHTVNKSTYILLALFLGGFGVHRFYAGRTLSGILFLCFFWTGIPAIIALVDLIMALLKPSVNGNIVM